jgi:HSP20 family protein
MAEETKSIEVKNRGVMNPNEAKQTQNRRSYAPRADIFETGDKLVVVADIPGVDENGIDITLEKNVLSLHAHPDFKFPEGYTLDYAEYGIGDYERSFVLSDSIDREKIEAVVKNGVLYLYLPKAGPAQTKKINVRSV